MIIAFKEDGGVRESYIKVMRKRAPEVMGQNDSKTSHEMNREKRASSPERPRNSTTRTGPAPESHIRKITSRVASVAPRLSRQPHSHKQGGYIIPVVATQAPQSLVVPRIYHNFVMGHKSKF
jgi:hypothetical protein